MALPKRNSQDQKGSQEVSERRKQLPVCATQKHYRTDQSCRDRRVSDAGKRLRSQDTAFAAQQGCANPDEGCCQGNGREYLQKRCGTGVIEDANGEWLRNQKQ